MRLSQRRRTSCVALTFGLWPQFLRDKCTATDFGLHHFTDNRTYGLLHECKFEILVYPLRWFCSMIRGLLRRLHRTFYTSTFIERETKWETMITLILKASEWYVRSCAGIKFIRNGATEI